MTDKELLELAAKAEGREIKWMTQICPGKADETFSSCWNPLTDDGDALRLAVKLGLKTSVGYDIGLVFCRPSESNEHEVWEPLGKNDPCAATRRCITRAAAEIGKAMKS
jgi:hypothetical protein